MTYTDAEAQQFDRQRNFDRFVAAYQDDLRVDTAQRIADDLDVSFYVEEIA